jgi:hypothetical protein
MVNTMTDLSPAAQAVLDSFLNGYICKPSCNVAFEADRNGIAAALRAAADQVVPAPHLPYDSCCDVNAAAIRAELLTISIELEAQ